MHKNNLKKDSRTYSLPFVKACLCAMLVTSMLTACDTHAPNQQASMTNVSNRQHSANSSESINPEGANVSTTIPNTTSQKNTGNLQRAKTPYVLGIPVYNESLNVIIHPLQTITEESKSRYGKSIDFSEDTSDKYLTTQEPAIVSGFEVNLNVHNLVFEPLTAVVDNDASTTSTPTTEKAQAVFPHNDFRIRKLFVPHVLTKNMRTCLAQDKYQKFCEETLVQGDVSTDTEQLADKVIVAEKVENTATFNRIIYRVKDSFYTNEQVKAINKKQGDIHHQQALYMSDAIGNGVKKLHPNDQFVTATKWLPTLKRYYFTTTADSNNNQKIELVDKQYSYRIDFSVTNPQVTLVNES